jgi:ABC-type Na+ efflux pump permease subunit
MRLALHCALKDLLRFRREPLALAVWIGIPLFIGLVMVSLFGRSTPAPRGLLLVADQDETFISSFLARAYTQGKLGEMITVEQTPLAEGRKRIAKGDGSALLVIPKGFSRAVLRNEPVKLELVTNPSQSILPSIIEEITGVLIDGGFYLRQLLGEDLSRLVDTGDPADSLIGDFSIKINRLIRNARPLIDPPSIEVATEVVERNPASQTSTVQMMYLSFLYMAVMFLASGYSGDIWKEKMQGTLRRLVATPGTVRHFLAGKLIAVCVVLVFLALVALATASLVLGAPMPNALLVVPWIVATGGGLYLMMATVAAYAPNQRAASALANLTMFPLAMFGGAFFPFEIMPDFLARIGRLTPNGWALVQLKHIVGGQALTTTLAGFAVAALAGALLFLATSRRLQRAFFT